MGCTFGADCVSYDPGDYHWETDGLHNEKHVRPVALLCRAFDAVVIVKAPDSKYAASPTAIRRSFSAPLCSTAETYDRDKAFALGQSSPVKSILRCASLREFQVSLNSPTPELRELRRGQKRPVTFGHVEVREFEIRAGSKQKVKAESLQSAIFQQPQQILVNPSES